MRLPTSRRHDALQGGSAGLPPQGDDLSGLGGLACYGLGWAAGAFRHSRRLGRLGRRLCGGGGLHVLNSLPIPLGRYVSAGEPLDGSDTGQAVPDRKQASRQPMRGECG